MPTRNGRPVEAAWALGARKLSYRFRRSHLRELIGSTQPFRRSRRRCSDRATRLDPDPWDRKGTIVLWSHRSSK
jgi:hypothetical protein